MIQIALLPHRHRRVHNAHANANERCNPRPGQPIKFPRLMDGRELNGVSYYQHRPAKLGGS